MLVRPALSSACAVLVLAACTGTGSGGGSSTTTSPSSDPGTNASPAGSSTPATSSDDRISKLTKAWTWDPLGTVADQTLHRVEDVVTTGDTIVLATVARTNALGLTGSRTTVIAADADTRTQTWSQEVDGDPADLRVVNGTVVLETTDTDADLATLVGFAADSGHELWRKDIATSYVVMGTSIVVNTTTGGKAARRFDAATGKVLAELPGGISKIIGGTGDRVLSDSEGTILSFDAKLHRVPWQLTATSTTILDEHVVGDTLVLVQDSTTRHPTLVGYDADTGKQSWTLPVTLDGDLTDTIVTDDQVLLRTDQSVTAVDVQDGSLAWQVAESGAAHLAASTATGANLLGCKRALVSVSAADGGLYAYADLPLDSFAVEGCVTAPVSDAPDSTDPDAVLVAGPTEVVAYRTTSSADPPTADDGFGRWGAPAEDACTAPDTTRTFAALNAATGPRWQLIVSHPKTCAWQGPTSFPVAQTGTLVSAAAAKAFLDPSRDAGGCKIPQATGGQESSLSVSGLGLPSGSGACLVAGYSVAGKHQTDLCTGVSRTSDGAWFYVVLVYPYREAANFDGPKRLRTVLKVLAS